MHVCIAKMITMLKAMIAHDISIEDKHMTYMILFHISLLYIQNNERNQKVKNTHKAIMIINTHINIMFHLFVVFVNMTTYTINMTTITNTIMK